MGLIYNFFILSKKKMSDLEPIEENKIKEIVENVENKNFSKDNLQLIINLLDIISTRGAFRINEYVSIGNFYDKISKMNVEDLTNDDLKSIKNILELCANRGCFRIDEFDTISKINALLSENITNK